MKRRDFGRALAVGSVGAVASRSGSAYPMPVKSLMHVGASGSTTVESLQFYKRHGVNNIDGGGPKFVPGKGWDVNEILEMKERCDKEGISLDMFHLPGFKAGTGTDVYGEDGYLVPSKSVRDTSPFINILFGKSPERDREIEVLHQMIEATAKAGMRGLNYNFCILAHQRTPNTPGRGGVGYSSFDISKVKEQSLTGAGRVTLEEAFERIAYFQERVIPVAEENKVQMACHLPDPPLKPNFRGVDSWDYPVLDGLKRFVETVDSPYNGFNFCVGTATEGLSDFNNIYEITRYFAERKKIFNVHFRNIRGEFNNFQEVFPDEGDIDMYKLAKVFRDAGYPYMLMVDHTPQHPDPAASRQAYAFQLGYIKALIQAANSEV